VGERFSRYPLVQLVDLDAAKGRARTASWSLNFAASCLQVGGGIRSATMRKLCSTAARRK